MSEFRAHGPWWWGELTSRASGPPHRLAFLFPPLCDTAVAHGNERWAALHANTHVTAHHGAEARRGSFAECAFDNMLRGPKACSTMKNLSSSVVASLLAFAVTVGAAPVFASSLSDAQPQCGDEKKESKGGDKKDDKSSDTKPKPPVQG